MNTKMRRFKSNDIGRDFVVGDLHGCYDALMQLMQFVNFDKTKDRMFSVGDLIDRGSQNQECLSLIEEPWFFAVRGNHEDMMWAVGKQTEHDYPATVWFSNGGDWARELIYDYPNVLTTMCDRYLADLPIIIVVGEGDRRFNIVHAELYKQYEPVTDKDIDTWNFSSENEDTMIWGRTIYQNHIMKNNDKLFHYELSPTYVGHTPLKVPTAMQSQYYIDTGAVFALRRPGVNTEHGLTIAEPATKKYWTNYVGDKERGIVESMLPSMNYDPTTLKTGV